MTNELRNTLIEIRNMAKSVKERSYSQKIVRDMNRIIDMAQSAIDRSLINRYKFGNMDVALEEYKRTHPENRE